MAPVPLATVVHVDASQFTEQVHDYLANAGEMYAADCLFAVAQGLFYLDQIASLPVETRQVQQRALFRGIRV